MLTADLVRARRRGAQLSLSELDAKGKAAALELATSLLVAVRAHVGKSRAEVDEVVDALVGSAKDRKLAAGLAKLLDDRCTFEEPSGLDPAELRREVFSRARLAWAELGAAQQEQEQGPEPEAAPREADLAAAAVLGLPARFDRLAVLSAVAAAHDVSVAAIEAALYSDLRSAQLLTSVEPLPPAALVELYELAGPQAMLLRAVRVSVEVESASPAAYRTLFRKLKFLRLLYVVTPRDEGGYLLDIDGPFSLFESATRYGLALALALPAIRELERWKLVADVRWGTQRTPLTCKLEGAAPSAGPAAEEPALPDELAAFVAAFEALDSDWKVAAATAILDLPGVGVCVPDLTFRHRKRRKLEVHLEVLGYWSRAAVWKRVELVEAGLAHRIVFAVGQQLRVSEEALGDELPGALYVYKRTLSARAVLERVEAVAAAPPIS